MRSSDPELERLRSEKEAAQREIDSAKAQLDRISPQRNAYRGQIQSINATIADLKQRINSERAAIGICKAARDRISADTHRYNLQSYQAALQEQYSIKNSYFSQMNMSRSEFDSALNSLRAAKERKQRAQEAFNTRLSQLKADREAEAQKWRETRCKKCGQSIRYRIDWNRVPNLCPSCRQQERDKWRETPCRVCGRAIRYNVEWAHIPGVCKSCKEARRFH